MNKTFDISTLRQGDHLLYRPSSFFGWLIAMKTSCLLSHIEIYAGGGKSVASRDGKGVQLYDFRREQLGVVLRPNVPFDFQKGMAFFETVKGDGYDWKDILTFICFGKPCGEARKEICSEFACLWDVAAGFNPVRKSIVADAVSPADFNKSPAFEEIWSDRK